MLQVTLSSRYCLELLQEEKTAVNSVGYVYFGEDIISNDTWGGVQIRDGEKSTMFDFGFTYSRPEGLFGEKIIRRV